MTTSWLSSSKGLPASWNAMTSALLCAKNLCWTLGLRSWCLRMVFFRVSMPASNSVMTRQFPVPPQPTLSLWRHTRRSDWGSHMHLQLFILLIGVLVESNHWERVLRFCNGEKSISKLSIESWVFHSHVQHFGHLHLEPASVIVVMVNTYITNMMLWIDDDNGITRYTRCNVFQKLLI